MICQECNGGGCSFCEGSGYVCNYCKDPYEHCDCDDELDDDDSETEDEDE